MTLDENPRTTPAAGRRPPSRLSVANHVGLALAALLALADLGAVFSLGQTFDPAQPGPPPEVLWFCFAMGLVTAVTVGLAWAGRWRRPAVRLAAVSRVLSAITSLPAFFVQDVPAGLVVLAAVGVVATLVAVWLMMLRPRRSTPAA